MSGTGYYTIEAQSFGILEAASHDYWVLRGPDGTIIEEMHGLAANSSTDDYVNALDIGIIGDELGFYRTKHRYGDTNNRDSSVMYQGTGTDVLARWNVAISEISYLNSLHLPYTPLGFFDPLGNVINSNSAFRIFGEIMGVPIMDFDGVIEPGLDVGLSYILYNYAKDLPPPQSLLESDPTFYDPNPDPSSYAYYAQNNFAYIWYAPYLSRGTVTVGALTDLGYGFAGDAATIKAALGSDIGIIARYDLNHGDLAGAVAAEAGRQQAIDAAALAALPSNTGGAVLEGAKWDHEVITWSLADREHEGSGQFSGFLGDRYEKSVEQAFDTWAAASGLTFKEVKDSTQSDIRIGFGAFDTENSGVIGYTSFKAVDGVIQPNAIIHLEDPNETALITEANGEQVYVGTEAEFSQVLLHEIGHALGLGSNSDPHSVLYYQLNSENRTLNNTDINGIQLVYGVDDDTDTVVPRHSANPALREQEHSRTENTPNADYHATEHDDLSQPRLQIIAEPSHHHQTALF